MSDRSQESNKPNFEMLDGAAKAHSTGAPAPVENSSADTGVKFTPGQTLPEYQGKVCPGVNFTPVSEPDQSIADEAVENQLVSQYQEPQTQYSKTPNELADVLLRVLDGNEFKVYFRLFRLSHGYKKTTCFVGHTALAQACNLSLKTIKYILPRLIALGLVRILAVYNSQKKKGTRYEVFTNLPEQPAAQGHWGKVYTGVNFTPIKGKDDDDRKGNPHQRKTMAIFTELTGRAWTKADGASYRKVAEVPIEKLELLMLLIHRRAAEPLRSFAFFAAAVQNELAAGASGQGAAGAGSAPGGLQQKYQKFAAEIRSAYTGGSLSPSDLIYKLKGRCLRDGLPWNDDVANQVLGG